MQTGQSTSPVKGEGWDERCEVLCVPSGERQDQFPSSSSSITNNLSMTKEKREIRVQTGLGEEECARLQGCTRGSLNQFLR